MSKKEPKNLVLIILLDGLSKDLSKKLIYSKKFLTNQIFLIIFGQTHLGHYQLLETYLPD